MDKTAKLVVDGKTFELPIVTGSEGERAIDISRLRQETGLITLDHGYANTGSCESSITFMDGEKGILRYRGIPTRATLRALHLCGNSLSVDKRSTPVPEGAERLFGSVK